MLRLQPCLEKQSVAALLRSGEEWGMSALRCRQLWLEPLGAEGLMRGEPAAIAAAATWRKRLGRNEEQEKNVLFECIRCLENI